MMYGDSGFPYTGFPPLIPFSLEDRSSCVPLNRQRSVIMIFPTFFYDFGLLQSWDRNSLHDKLILSHLDLRLSFSYVVHYRHNIRGRSQQCNAQCCPNLCIHCNRNTVFAYRCVLEFYVHYQTHKSQKETKVFQTPMAWRPSNAILLGRGHLRLCSASERDKNIDHQELMQLWWSTGYNNRYWGRESALWFSYRRTYHPTCLNSLDSLIYIRGKYERICPLQAKSLHMCI